MKVSSKINAASNPLKAIGTNTIPTKNLKILINHVSSRLTELFNVYKKSCLYKKE